MQLSIGNISFSIQEGKIPTNVEAKMWASTKVVVALETEKGDQVKMRSSFQNSLSEIIELPSDSEGTYRWEVSADSPGCKKRGDGLMHITVERNGEKVALISIVIPVFGLNQCGHNHT